MLDIADAEIRIGRDPGNTVVLASPLVSREHAVVRISAGRLELENVGLNSCVVGDTEVYAGQTAVFEPGAKVRIWPYTLTFESETATVISRSELESHLRSIMADLELRIHKKLLERLDLYEFQPNRVGDTDSIVLLENNIEDVCRELDVFGAANEPLIEEISGLTLRDHLVNQLIMETGGESLFDMTSLTHNEFDVPATLVPERETELHSLLVFIRERLAVGGRTRLERAHPASGEPVCRRVSPGAPAPAPGAAQVPAAADAEKGPERHRVRLRAAAGSAAGAVDHRNHGGGQRPDLRRAQRRDRTLRPAVHLGQSHRVDHRADRGPGRPPDRQEPAAGRRAAARRIARERRDSAAGGARSVRHDPQVPDSAADDERADRVGQHHPVGRRVLERLRDQSVQHPDQRRHWHRQDDVPERAQQFRALQGADRHDRGHDRIASAPGTRGHAWKANRPTSKGPAPIRSATW